MALGTRVRSASRWVVIVAALFATFVVFFLTSMRVAVRAREVQVPDLTGKTVSEATTALAGVGLTLKIDTPRRPDPKVPADHVLSQDPERGATLRRQRAVKVRVSDGIRAPIVPTVTGQSERAAQLQLAEGQVTISAIAEIRDGDYPSDAVIAQDPPPQSHNATVTLLVNRGQAGPTFVMPDLIGTSGARVAEILRARSFRVSIVAEVPYPGIPSGIVIKQTPQAGFEIATGDQIVLEVSR